MAHIVMVVELNFVVLCKDLKKFLHIPDPCMVDLPTFTKHLPFKSAKCR